MVSTIKVRLNANKRATPIERQNFLKKTILLSAQVKSSYENEPDSDGPIWRRLCHKFLHIHGMIIINVAAVKPSAVKFKCLAGWLTFSRHSDNTERGALLSVD